MIFKHMEIIVDKKSYPSRKMALAEFWNAILFCDGSEKERMTFAYLMIQAGYTNINTYKEIAL